MVGTSEGTVYFVKISKWGQNCKMKTIGICRSAKEEPVVNITVDLLIKGFTANREKVLHCKVYLGNLSGRITCVNLTNKLVLIGQEPCVVYKKNFSTERQLRENFTA
jgi:hypothetical protein